MSSKYDELSLEIHEREGGKLSVESKIKINNQDELSVAYTPGVAAVSKAIAADKSLARKLTIKGNSVAVISDGSAVLGLGNIGPEAALPVMEGKCALLKEFADVDGYPLVLNTQDTEEIIQIIKAIAPGFSGINLEDISAPRCFEIENRLKKELDIPVFHDDQHGTAIVVLGGLINALKVVEKKISDIRVVISGAGSAGIAITNLLDKSGVGQITLLDSKGAINSNRQDLNDYKIKVTKLGSYDNREGGLAENLQGADVFIGVSQPNIVTAEMVKSMNTKPIIFALANPEPEISPELAHEAGAAVIATGRSDYPNQLNNVLAFPGIFRGLLDSGINTVSDEIKIRAAEALAGLVESPTAEIILPGPFDKSVAQTVAQAVAKIA